MSTNLETGLLTLITVGFFVLLILGARLILPVIDWIRSKVKGRDKQAEYISDLFKIQHKWAKRGYTNYSMAIQFIINELNKEEEEVAKTANGRAVQEYYKNRD